MQLNDYEEEMVTCGKSEKTLEENFDIVFESNIKVPCCIVVIGALHHG